MATNTPINIPKTTLQSFFKKKQAVEVKQYDMEMVILEKKQFDKMMKQQQEMLDEIYDIEDAKKANRIVKRIESGKEKTIPFEEVLKKNNIIL